MRKEEKDSNLLDEKAFTITQIKALEKKTIKQTHTYGKYGTLAKQYLEENNIGKLWALGGDLPEYLHGIDQAAGELYERLNASMTAQESFKKTGNYLHDLRIESEKQNIIHEKILHEIVYLDEEQK